MQHNNTGFKRNFNKLSSSTLQKLKYEGKGTSASAGFTLGCTDIRRRRHGFEREAARGCSALAWQHSVETHLNPKPLHIVALDAAPTILA